MSSRPACSTKRVTGQPRLHRETLSQNKNKTEIRMRIKADIMTPAQTSGLPVHTVVLFANIIITRQVGVSGEIRHLESWSQRIESMSPFWKRSGRIMQVFNKTDGGLSPLSCP